MNTAPQHDFRRFGVLVLLSLSLGVAANLARRPPVPWRYLSKAERMAEAVQQLTSSTAKPAGLAEGSFPTVSLDEVKAALARRDAWIIDARPSLFYQVGHLPAAVNLPREKFKAAYQQHPALAAQPGRLTIVYCQTATCEDSQWVAQGLKALGFADVRIFTGGWKAWEAAGQPTERTP